MKTTGIALLIVGLVSIIIQNTFYGYMDAEGFIHDSIFLPLGAISTILGVLLLSVWGISALLKKVRK